MSLPTPASDAAATPRPAATLILLRRGGRHADRGVEVLMAKRTEEARFMPGVWVFPGGAVDAAELDGGDEEAAHQAAAARELHEEAGIELPADSALVAWSRWITPEVEDTRFDTRFYVALAPPHSAPKADETEITEVAWIAPPDALERHGRGELELVFPTVKNLETLLPYSSSDEVMAAARERVVEPILPKVIGTREDWRIVLPGEHDYPAS
jgi:8-oxo-dGTP pyrophosphatase MutT (NUDIX family)